MDQPMLISVSDAAAALGVSKWTIRLMTRTGKLPCVRIGRRVLLEPAALINLINARRME
jgi:excisionase family DNA binding protein